MFKKGLAVILVLCFIALAISGCGQTPNDDKAEEPATEAVEIVTNLPKPDMSKWKYSEDDDIYYQIGISYCETPADESYEKLGVFIPGAYMDAADNGDGTFTCSLKEDAKINGCTASSAPIVMPVYTEGYAADKAMTDEAIEAMQFTKNVSQYTSRGFVYVHTGCRGANEGVPTGVTDLKAAVRYLRYADDVLAGDAESIFAYGMSAGGAQAAILGSAGDSELYAPYLEKIGAVQGVSDAIAGSMDWCPITSLSTANAEYEWMMGCTRSGRSDEWNAISDALARAYADYVNSAGFVDQDGNALTLTESKDGIYQAGSYYDYIKSVIERSLNNYLSDRFNNGTAQDYIDSLNANKKWVTYDKSTNTATITSVEDFCMNCKRASDYLVAFDWPNSMMPLFGHTNGRGAHFDRILSDIMTKLNSQYASEYADDMGLTDSFGYSLEQRMNMFSPLYYLMKSEEGYGKSNVAKYWRIRTGIEQPTTSLTTEVNLALALEQYDGVESVDFETVWLQNHSEAERTGNSAENFIAWVDACMKN